jgi:hypothetical protein
VGAVKVRGAVRVAQVGLIVDGRVERGVPAGRGVQRLRPGVRTLEVERLGKPVPHRNLQ